MALTRIPLPDGTFMLRETTASNQQLVNVMPQIPSDQSAQKFVLVPTPGLVSQVSGGSGPVRAMVVRKDTQVCYTSGGSVFVSGTNVGSVDASGTCSMATDGVNTVITCNARAFLQSGGGITEITGSMPFAPGPVCYNSGYFVFAASQSQQFFISGLNDPTTYDPLDFATAEGGSTSIWGVMSTHLDVWFFCHNSIEVWYLSGAADFPFQRQLGGFLEVGTVGQTAMARFDNSLAWLGNDRKIYKADGYSPIKISDAGLDDWLFDRTISDVVAMELSINGQNCVAFNFPAGGLCWVMSATTQKWFNMTSSSGFPLPGQWRGNCSVIANGLQLVGDVSSGTVAAFDPGVSTEIGAAIWRGIQFPSLFNALKRTYIGRLLMDVYTSNGTDSFLLQWQDEGNAFNSGRTMSTAKAPALRVYTTRLGSFFRRVFRITATPTGTFAILDAWAEVTPSAESGDGNS